MSYNPNGDDGATIDANAVFAVSVGLLVHGRPG
jgi:hypothetical protein